MGRSLMPVTNADRIEPSRIMASNQNRACPVRAIGATHNGICRASIVALWWAGARSIGLPLVPGQLAQRVVQDSEDFTAG